jgi:hypothetical protein
MRADTEVQFPILMPVCLRALQISVHASDDGKTCKEEGYNVQCRNGCSPLICKRFSQK